MTQFRPLLRRTTNINGKRQQRARQNRARCHLLYKNDYLLFAGMEERSLSSKTSTLIFLLLSVKSQIHSALMPPSADSSCARQMLPREAFAPACPP